MKIYEHFEAVPSRVVGLMNLLFGAGRSGLDEAATKALLQPETLRKPDAPPSLLAPRTIDAVLETGLIVRTEDGDNTKLALTTEAYEALAQSADRSMAIRKLLEERLLSITVNDETNKFAILCAWLLTKPVTWLPQQYIDIQNTMQADGLAPADFRVASEANLANVLYWARYLGLIWLSQDKYAMSPIADPTSYLLRHLDDLVPAGARIDAFAFRSEVGKVCPVLDGGIVRKSLLGRVQAATGKTLEEDRLSDALSLAIQQLVEAQLLHYDCPNDQRRFLRLYDEQRIAFVERSMKTTSAGAALEAII